MTKMTGRALTAAALATAASWGSSAAAAAPSSNPGVDRHTFDYASVFMVEGDVFSDFTVYAPAGQQPFARGEFHVRGYECLPEDEVAATIDPLTSATATGTLQVTCYWHGDWDAPDRPEVLVAEGTVEVGLSWTAEGPVKRRTIAGPWSSCVTHLQIRHAQITGEVQVTIPALEFDQSATAPGDDDDTLRHEETICRTRS